MTLPEPLNHFSNGFLLYSEVIIIVLVRYNPVCRAPTRHKVGVKIISVLRKHYDQVIGHRILYITNIPEYYLTNQFGGAVAPMEENVDFAFGVRPQALIRIVNVTIFMEAIIIIYERIFKELVLFKLSKNAFGAPL